MMVIGKGLHDGETSIAFYFSPGRAFSINRISAAILSDQRWTYLDAVMRYYIILRS